MPTGLAGGRWRTRANALTALRFAAAPLCALAISTGRPAVALASFGLAVVTDWIDGRVARRFGETSALGGLFDHATDATFVALGCGAWALRGELPVVLPFLISLAFLQYVFDSRGGAGSSWALRASWLGRWNGIGYFVAMGVPVVRDGLLLGWPSSAVCRAVGWALVVTTLVSMADRFWASRSRA
jgi:phosphatidylglycerophosphate synthase